MSTRPDDAQDALDAAWDQLQQDERHEREDAALARARESTKELRTIINDIHRKPNHDRPQ
jgi:hypothetical protein